MSSIDGAEASTGARAERPRGSATTGSLASGAPARFVSGVYRGHKVGAHYLCAARARCAAE